MVRADFVEKLAGHESKATKGISSFQPVSRLPHVPEHELLHPIASGAYGEVWLALNAIGTRRAVKLVHRDRHVSVESFEREFKGLQKFEPVSRTHDGLVDILTLGLLPDGAGFYYVMELADPEEMKKEEGGKQKPQPTRSTTTDSSFCILHSSLSLYAPRTLSADLKSRDALPADEVLALGIKLTAALAHLHAHGLVHRDVKPSNILFVGGAPKLADAGLVAAVDDARSLVGTAGYIAPEGPGTPQADLYALGKVLYEAAFGKDRQEFPALPADVASRADHARLLELNAILLKACATDRRERYQSVDDMRADLELLHVGRSVKRRQAWQHCKSLIKRISIAAASLAATAVVMITLVRQISPDSTNPADRLSTNDSANVEYKEGVHCRSRDTKEGLAEALDHLNRAIAIDPNFIMAYAGLFDLYLSGGLLGLSRDEQDAKMRGSADKLMELNPKLAEAQAAQAFIEFLDSKWETAEPRFRYAVRLNPKSGIAHEHYGFCLMSVGRQDEALKELQVAEILDPELPRIKRTIGNVFYFKREFREAIKRYEKANKLEPNYPGAHNKMGWAYRALGNFTNAIDEFEKSETLAGKDAGQVHEHFDKFRRAYANDGARGYWREYLAQAEQAGYLLDQSMCHAELGNLDQALTLLEKADANGQRSPDSLLWVEAWDPLHENPRFIALLKKAGLRK